MKKKRLLARDPEQCGPAVGTLAFDGVAAILEGDRLGRGQLSGLLLLHAEGCSHGLNGSNIMI